MQKINIATKLSIYFKRPRSEELDIGGYIDHSFILEYEITIIIYEKN